MNIFDKETLIITGSNRGIGQSILLKFAEFGCKRIIACARKHTETFEYFINDIANKYGIDISPVYFDLSSQEETKSAVKQIRQLIDFKNVVLVNCAGCLSEHLRFNMQPIENSKRLFEVDYWGQVYFTQLLSRHMQKHRNGNIIFISSISSFEGFFSSFDYCAAKAAINVTVKQMARELGRLNIRVNAVAPGLIETDMIKSSSQESFDLIKQGIMLGRLGKKEEVANTVAFLASNLATYITGQIVRCDGGTTPPKADW